MRYSTLKYAVAGRIARITLNRPARLNAIDEKMPREIRRAVEAANEDNRVHVIVLAGAGKAFCAGYDLKKFAEGDSGKRWNQPMPWDPMRDYLPAIRAESTAGAARFASGKGRGGNFSDF